MRGRTMHQPKDNAIHVANLPSGITVEFIKTLFSESGTIVNIYVKQKPTNCYAFVEYSTAEEAQKAVRDFNYTKLNGESIIVTLTSEPILKAIQSGEGNLFVKGLDDTIDCSQLHELFANFGEVISVRIPTLNGKTRGFAYVQFLNQQDAEKARSELSDSTINGKAITIGPFLKKQDRPVSPALQNSLDPTFTNIFIKNLPDSITTLLHLLSLFKEYGEVISARFVQERHIGYAQMSNHNDAVKAVIGLNGRTIFGKRLSACRSLSVAERAAFHRPGDQQQQSGNQQQDYQQNVQNPETLNNVDSSDV